MLQTAATKSNDESGLSHDELALLESIQRRVLWLSTAIVHHANHVRPNPDKTKIGGRETQAKAPEQSPPGIVPSEARSNPPARASSDAPDVKLMLDFIDRSQRSLVR